MGRSREKENGVPVGTQLFSVEKGFLPANPIARCRFERRAFIPCRAARLGD